MSVGKTASIIGNCSFRIETDRLAVIRDGAVVVTRVLVCIAAFVICVGIVRIKPDRLVIVSDSTDKFAIAAYATARPKKKDGLFGSSVIALS